MAFLANFSSNLSLLLILVVVFQLQCSSDGACNFYEGSRVIDQTPPFYNATCPFIDREFNCQINGRPDSEYLNYQWQPFGCNLIRFNGMDFLKRFLGKHIMFVGDSLGVDQYNSLACLLYNAAPNLKYNGTTEHFGDISITTITISEYNVTVSMDLNHFFVDIVTTPQGKILTLDSIQDGKHWLGVDMLIFNTGHWWIRKKPEQPWDYVQDGKNVYQDIDRMYALKRGLATWASWMDANIDTKKTTVFFEEVSPDHFNGADWGQPKASCGGQTRPILGPKYPGPYPSDPVNIIKSTLANMRTPVTLLDTTALSLLQIDGHPSYYEGMHGHKGVDCSHWCLPSLPDTWNQIVYYILISV